MPIVVAHGTLTISPGGGQSHIFTSPPGFVPFNIQMWTADPTEQANFSMYPALGMGTDAWTGVRGLDVSFTSTAAVDIVVNFFITYTTEESVSFVAYGGV